MPILNVKVSQPASQSLMQAITELLLDRTIKILRKKRELTSIVVDFVPPEHWWVGGETLAAQGRNSFYFDIRVVDGTNTKDEKATYIQSCYEGFENLLGQVHGESYIHVHDVKADAYGYGGLTQEHRYIAAKT
jgi:4-oxalocrotonate tautomerase